MCKTERTSHANDSTGTGDFAAALEKLGSMPAQLAKVAAALQPSKWKMRTSDGSFSLTEHACHLRDIEIEGYRARLERILGETKPALPDLDGAALARARDYHRQDFGKAQAVFAAVRADLLQRLGGLSAEERQRTGILEGAGEITIEGLVAKMLEHDGEHRAELEQLQRELSL
jgi:hypothetical protein